MTAHIVKAYDEELKHLSHLIHEMGRLTLHQIDWALSAVRERDTHLAETVVARDEDLNQLEISVDKAAIRILALRQPVAQDLRLVVASLKISNQMERIADYASNMAKRAIKLHGIAPFLDEGPFDTMVHQTKKMITLALEAFETFDETKAAQVWEMDKEVDQVYNTYLTGLLTHMTQFPDHIGPCTHLLFVAKNIERIGDQATNVAEAVYYMVTGQLFKENH